MFAVGPASFSVVCPTAGLKEAVEALFVDLAEGNAGDSWEQIDLVAHPERQLAVIRAGHQIGNPTAPQGALAKLVTTVNRLALDGDPASLHLHSAAVSDGDAAVLISAPSGTGKTTLTAALLETGWSYLSDEMVGLTKDSSAATGFPKPLLLKPSGEGVLDQLESRSIRVDEGPHHWWMVPASSVSAPIAKSVIPRLLVLLQHPNGASYDSHPTVAQLHPADAVVALMEQTMDAQRYGDDALVTLAHLAARSVCIVLSTGVIEECVAIVDEFSKRKAIDMPLLPLDTKEGNYGSHRVAPTVRSVLLGDRAVVHDTATGVIVALDQGGTAIWSALHGRNVEWWDSKSMAAPSAIAFLDELASHGLLEQAGTSEDST